MEIICPQGYRVEGARKRQRQKNQSLSGTEAQPTLLLLEGTTRMQESLTLLAEVGHICLYGRVTLIPFGFACVIGAEKPAEVLLRLGSLGDHSQAIDIHAFFLEILCI